MTTAVCLGADIGGTGARWILADAKGRCLAEGVSPPASGADWSGPRRANLEASLQALASAARSQLPPGWDIGAAVLGLTGSGLCPDPALRALCAKALGLTLERLGLMTDILLAHAAAFDFGPGHLVLSGTGSAALSMDGDLSPTLIGGHALPAGDPGSAVAITISAVSAICRESDRCGVPLSRLARAMFEASGVTELRSLSAWARQAERGSLGLAALAVAEAASAGDATACDILRAAGRDLASLAETLLRRCGFGPIALAGRTALLHPTFRQGFDDGLSVARASGLAVCEPRFVFRTPTRAAVDLARGLLAGESPAKGIWRLPCPAEAATGAVDKIGERHDS
jgi:glucosamine kinase